MSTYLPNGPKIFYGGSKKRERKVSCFLCSVYVRRISLRAKPPFFPLSLSHVLKDGVLRNREDDKNEEKVTPKRGQEGSKLRRKEKLRGRKSLMTRMNETGIRKALSIQKPLQPAVFVSPSYFFRQPPQRMYTHISRYASQKSFDSLFPRASSRKSPRQLSSSEALGG